uniref:ZP domain-containing protein n=1 Tax=Ciona savignyi TaxID=51511 RepID=H2Y9H8_CIOSA
MDYPFLPQITLQVLTFNISGRGQFSAVMQLYKSNLYEDPYLTPPTLQSNETLYVGVSLLEIQDNSTFMTLRRCWGTPERAPDHAQQYPIISDYCKVPESLGGSIRVIDNGESRRVKWEGSVFKFISFRQVWLHCEIRVCFGDDCKPDCDESTSRRRRSVNNGNEGSHVITTGPISLNKLREPVLEPVGSNTTPQTGAASIDMEKTTVLIVVGALCFIILLCFVIIVSVLIRLRKRHSQKSGTSISSLPSSIETTCEFQVPATNGTDYLEICRPATSVSSFSLATPPSGGKKMAQNVHSMSQLDSLNETGSSRDNPAYDGSSLDISAPPYNSAYKLPMHTNKEPGETLPGNS